MATQTGSYDFKAAKAVQTNLDNMEVGGRNLALSTSWDAASKTKPSTNAYVIYGAKMLSETLQTGDTVTVSYWARSQNGAFNANPYIGYNNGSSNSSAHNSPTYQQIGTSWTYRSETFTLTHEADRAWITAASGGGSNYVFEVKGFKVERGNVATDWTPAPEDQTTYVDNSVYQSSQPNLSPYFSFLPYSNVGSGNPYWYHLHTDRIRSLGDGWCGIQYDNSSGSSVNYANHREQAVIPLKPSTDYTIMLEVRNFASTGTIKWFGLVYRTGNTIGSFSTDKNVDITGNGTYYLKGTTKADLSDATEGSGGYLRVSAGGVMSLDVRVSLYEGDYSGPYKPYVGNLLYGSASDSVEYIVGTQTATTNVWTGVTKDDAIYAGKKIAYYLPYAGNSSAATLNLTLSGGGTTGAKNVRWNNTNVTTHYPQYSVIQLVYDGTYWRTSAYNSDTVNRKRIENAVKVCNANMTRYCIAGHVTESTAANSGYKMVASGVVIDLHYPIAYLNQDTANGQSYAVAANATTTNFYTAINNVNITYTKSGWTGTQYAMCFLKGTVDGSTFTVHSDVFTTTAPTTDDGFAYIPIGMTYSTTQVNFDCDNSLYVYKDGAFGPASIREAAEAAKVAGNYIWESALNDMWLHSEDHGPDIDPTSQTYGQATADTYGWRIGSVFELVRAGLSYFKMWVDSNLVAKVRVGLDAAGHAIFSPDGMEVFDYDSTLSEPAAVSVAQFGKSGARVGTSGGKHVDVDSDGMVVKNNTTELAKIGSSGFHIGKADTYTSNYFSVDSNGNGIFQGAKLVVRDSPYDPANDLASCTIKHHYVKVGGFDQNDQNFHAVSLYASSDSARVGLWDEVGSKWVLNYLANKVTIPNTLAFENGTTQWDNSQGITHLQTPVVSNKQAEFTFEPDGGFFHRTSTNGGSSWSDYAQVGEVVESDVSSAVSVATATNKSIASVTLKPGKWLIAYGGQFASNSTGYRSVFLYTTQNSAGNAAWYRASLVQGPAANGAATYLRGACAVELTSTTTVYLTLYHTRGSALNCYGNIRAMRVW